MKTMVLVLFTSLIYSGSAKGTEIQNIPTAAGAFRKSSLNLGINCTAKTLPLDANQPNHVIIFTCP